MARSTFSDGTHNVVVNIVNGAPGKPIGQPVRAVGPADHGDTVGERWPAGNTFNVTATARLDQDLDEAPDGCVCPCQHRQS